MNKEQLINQFDEKLQQLRDEFISKLEDDKKEFKLTYPEDGASVYFIHRGDKSVTNSHFWSDSTTDKNIFELGEYFNTEKEAEQHLKERKLLFKLHQWAKMKNEGWEPDWESIFQEKYYIFYDYYRKELCTSFNNSTGAINKLPYFKNRKIAQECIDLFGDEIIEVLV